MFLLMMMRPIQRIGRQIRVDDFFAACGVFYYVAAITNTLIGLDV